MIDEWCREDFVISTDRNKIDLKIVHDFLTHSYWADGIPIDMVHRSIDNSLCFGVYHQTQQIGFARVITDYATFAYIGDVFIVERYRGHGLSKWLMQVISDHPKLQGMRLWLLATRDAHDLYVQSGFMPLTMPERFMFKYNPAVYIQEKSQEQHRSGDNNVNK